jgi:hypothetical protein
MVSANAKVGGMVVLLAAVMASTPYFAKRNTVSLQQWFFSACLIFFTAIIDQ